MIIKRVCLLLAFAMTGTSIAVSAQDTRYYYIREADYQCLVTKAEKYAQVSGNGPVTIVFSECANFPKKSPRLGQYPEPPSQGRRDANVNYPDGVIALSRPQLVCLSRGALGAPRKMRDPSSGFIKLPTTFGC
jgi:hypothetical protein